MSLTGVPSMLKPRDPPSQSPDLIRLLDAQIAELRSRLDAKEQHCMSLMASEAQARVDLVNERSRADVAAAKMVAAEQALSTQQRRAESLLAECSALEAKVQMLNDTLGTTRQQLGRLEGEVTTLRTIQATPDDAEESDDSEDKPVTYMVTRNEVGDIVSITATPGA